MESLFFTIAIVLFFIIWQIKSCIDTHVKIKLLKNVFPEDIQYLYFVDSKIKNDNPSAEFEETLNDINAYLEENKEKIADYQIVKEIVERKSLAIDEEVDTMISTPLYCGLMATILGAAVGIIYFAWANLPVLIKGDEVASEGITLLLTDIGVAMFTSFVGVCITAVSTYRYKNAKRTMLNNENRLLTWIQTRVFPNLSDNIISAMFRMTQNLNRFNGAFEETTRDLRATLSMVSNDYKNQIQILESINQLKVTKIATANIEVYDKLKGCTDEIGKLCDMLNQSEQYITRVVELNENLGRVEDRTKLSENLGTYFKEEIEYVKNRQGLIRQSISTIDSVIQETLENLGSDVKQSLSDITSVFQSQNQSIMTLMEEQQNVLSSALETQKTAISQKMTEMEDPFTGLKEVFDGFVTQIGQGVERINSSFEMQNTAIQEMLIIQKERVEEELSAHRQIIESQIKEIPTQINSLSKISTVIENLNKSISEQQEQMNVQTQLLQTLVEKGMEIPEKETKGKMNFLIPFGICGSFLLLLMMLLAQLFDIKL